jgi:diguanylate cyclase (GGDEF)-like protein
MKTLRGTGLSNGMIGGSIGFALGLGAPAGWLLLRALTSGGGMDLEWFGSEYAAHGSFYIYLTLTTPAVFALFGTFLGGLTDRLRAQQNALLKLSAELERRSITDELTGVHNRHHLTREIDKEIERSVRHGHPLSGIMIDIDDFKGINDRFGHTAGDRALRDIAHLLQTAVRSIDTVGRYGGDEFVVLLPESGPEGARVVADRILREVRQYRLPTDHGPVPVTVSAGIVSFADAGTLTRTAFFDRIDRSLFQAKFLGKNRVFDSDRSSAG